MNENFKYVTDEEFHKFLLKYKHNYGVYEKPIAGCIIYMYVYLITGEVFAEVQQSSSYAKYYTIKESYLPKKSFFKRIVDFFKGL